jgi:DNA helicase-2/ATP-dependent DNA helicase PcrA
MEHNMRRYAPELSMHAAWPHYLDSLKLARLLHPMQKSYKLRNLLEQLHLEGKNSHLADDDILATLSLVIHCYECARSIVGHQMEFLSRHQNMAVRLRQRYAPLYLRALHQLHAEAPGPLLSLELQHAYSHFLQEGLIGQLPKLKYIISYIEQDMLTPKSGQSLASQLARHYSDLCTMKEADLCGSASMTERVFVSTVHKAKGLEFDNVIVYDAVDGKYPSVYAKDRSQFDEEARKFYVAISRARRRLIVTYCHNSISRWGVIHAKVPSPFMTILRSSFI